MFTCVADLCLSLGPMYKARSTGGGSYKAPGDPESTHGASQGNLERIIQICKWTPVSNVKWIVKLKSILVWSSMKD